MVSPREFIQAFKDVFKNDHKDFKAAWQRTDTKKLTESMLGTSGGGPWEKHGGMLFKVIEQLDADLKGYREYWTLDGIAYKENICTRKVNPFKEKGACFAERIDIAVEHENDITTAWQEVNKLCAFNAGLRVLVTYDHGWKPGESDKKPKAAHDCIARWKDLIEEIPVDTFSLLVGKPVERGFSWEMWKNNDDGFARFDAFQQDMMWEFDKVVT